MTVGIKITVNGNETMDLQRHICQSTVRMFDDACPDWTHDEDYNEIYLRKVEDWFNAVLKYQGFVFLNDVFTKFCIPRTVLGQVIGWIAGDTISFGIEKCENAVFKLNFNCTEILSKL